MTTRMMSLRLEMAASIFHRRAPSIDYGKSSVCSPSATCTFDHPLSNIRSIVLHDENLESNNSRRSYDMVAAFTLWSSNPKWEGRSDALHSGVISTDFSHTEKQKNENG